MHVIFFFTTLQDYNIKGHSYLEIAYRLVESSSWGRTEAMGISFWVIADWRLNLRIGIAEIGETLTLVGKTK